MDKYGVKGSIARIRDKVSPKEPEPEHWRCGYASLMDQDGDCGLFGSGHDGSVNAYDLAREVNEEIERANRPTHGVRGYLGNRCVLNHDPHIIREYK